jgi:hypothetical protein
MLHADAQSSSDDAILASQEPTSMHILNSEKSSISFIEKDRSEVVSFILPEELAEAGIDASQFQPISLQELQAQTEKLVRGIPCCYIIDVFLLYLIL